MRPPGNEGLDGTAIGQGLNPVAQDLPAGKLPGQFTRRQQKSRPARAAETFGTLDKGFVHQQAAGRDQGLRDVDQRFAARLLNSASLRSSAGKKLSTRTSCRVMSWGVPRVAMVVKTESALPPTR